MRGFVVAMSVTLALTLAATAAPARAEQRLVTLATPSQNVDPNRVAFNGDDHPRELRINVLLPDGYDAAKSYPVLYLLHGVGDAYDTWAKESRGDIAETAKGFEGIIVMPEGARGFYTNWWNEGRRGDPGWERYYLDELIPFVESHFSIRPERRWHAIAGLSMGGLGSTFLGSQVPGYFGSIASFSGFVDHQRAEIPLGLTLVGGVEYTDIFGPVDGFYATGHNPTRLVENLRFSRVFVAVGDGTPEPGVSSEPGAIAGGGPVEADLRQQNDAFVTAAGGAGADVTYRPRHGVHDWPYWRMHLREAIAWGFFAPVTERPGHWAYRTVAQTGDMWGFHFRFAAPPEEVVRFARDERSITGDGSGTVTIVTPAGCEITATLPFERALPATCAGAKRAAIRGTVTPRRTRAGKRTRFRFRASTAAGPLRSATIRFAGHRLRTSRSGRAATRLRLRAGRYRVRFTKPGLRGAHATVVVTRAPRFTG